MVNRINQNNYVECDRLTRQDAVDAINYISESRTPAQSQPRQLDDLIMSLANAHENRRARQVTEWESMRRHSVQTAS